MSNKMAGGPCGILPGATGPRAAGRIPPERVTYLVSSRAKKLSIPQHIAYPGPLCYNANPEVPTVQFGRKTRNLAAASRRFFGERPNQAEPALGLNPGTTHVLEEEENAMTPPPQEESMVAGDPTQRLLTALGRFQRQVSRAEEGAPQETWCDECMNQLITGIEIALNEDWADVKEALTDVARILQTYEDVGRASESIYFLKDSYEILCLMVGDLIVGNVRSGVMKKWQDRYERALDELGDAGLTLVDDEGPGGGAPDRGWSDPAATTMDLDSGGDFDDFIEEQTGGLGAPAFDNALEPAPRNQGFPADPGDPFAPLDLDGMDGSPFGAPEPAAATQDLPSLDDLLGRPVADTDDLDEESNSQSLDLSEDFTAESDHIGYGLMDEEEEPAEEAPANEPEPRLEIEEAVAELELADAPVPPREPELELSLEPEPEPEPEPAPAPARVEQRAAAPAPAPAPEPEPEPAPGSPEALFRTAQQAMAQGNLADAKVFALQLAVNMAKMEADQVAGRIALIEADIAQNAQAIATGEHAVGEAEFRVLQLEEQVTICQREFDAKREEIGRLRDEVATVEGGVAELNRQIEELIARRDEEVRRLAQCQQNLDDNLSEESRMQSELEALSEEEVGSRENLDGARDHVLVLKQTGEAHESYLRAAQAELESRRTAVADIERTIQQVTGVAPETAAGEAVPETGAAPAESNEQSAEGDGNTAGDGSSQA